MLWPQERALLQTLPMEDLRWIEPVLIHAKRRYSGPLDEIERRRLAFLGQRFSQIGPRVYEPLRRGLQHRWWTVREATLHSIRWMGTRHAAPLRREIEARLNDSHHQVRRVALYNLRTLFDRSFGPPNAPWYLLLGGLAFFVGIVGGCGWFLGARGWPKKRIVLAVRSMLLGALSAGIPIFLFYTSLHQGLQTLEPHAIYDDTQAVSFAMRLSAFVLLVGGALWALYWREKKDGFSPSMRGLLYALLALMVVSLFAGLLAIPLTSYQIPMQPLFGGFAAAAALASVLFGYALSFAQQKR